jgi:hypothetical protein
MADNEFWAMPWGGFHDLWECHCQYMGWSEPLKTIDDIIPF